MYNLLLLFSLIICSSVLYLITDSIKESSSTKKNTLFYQQSVQMISNLSLVGFAIGGFLVGFGTKLGNGCTSGHGVCGLPRFSLRSFVAVISFFSFAVITANTKQYVFSWVNFTQRTYVRNDLDYKMFSVIILIIFVILFVLISFIYSKTKKELQILLTTEGIILL